MKELTTLQVRLSGEEDYVYVFAGHLAKDKLSPTVKKYFEECAFSSCEGEQWVQLKTFAEVEDYLCENDIGFITVNHTALTER
tara:strand:+ start:716 stop:964 length:249 start_codon:yes stop_codon:yes gene_type:complete